MNNKPTLIKSRTEDIIRSRLLQMNGSAVSPAILSKLTKALMNPAFPDRNWVIVSAFPDQYENVLEVLFEDKRFFKIEINRDPTSDEFEFSELDFEAQLYKAKRQTRITLTIALELLESKSNY